MSSQAICSRDRTPLIQAIERAISSGQITIEDRREFNAAVCSGNLLSADEQAAIREAIERIERGWLQVVD
jgi:hypothetical protein